jgi:hypothetical protein
MGMFWYLGLSPENNWTNLKCILFKPLFWESSEAWHQILSLHSLAANELIDGYILHASPCYLDEKSLRLEGYTSWLWRACWMPKNVAFICFWNRWKLIVFHAQILNLRPNSWELLYWMSAFCHISFWIQGESKRLCYIYVQPVEWGGVHFIRFNFMDLISI